MAPQPVESAITTVQRLVAVCRDTPGFSASCVPPPVPG
jgi:hypothetical protein